MVPYTTVLSGDLAAAIGVVDEIISRVTHEGVTIQVYGPTGRPPYATATM